MAGNAKFTYLIDMVARFTALNQARQQLTSFNRTINSGLKGMNKNFRTMRERLNRTWMSNNNLMKSLRRVAVVVPIWMAFRAVIQGLLTDIRNGLMHIRDFDKGIARATAVMGDVSNVEKFQDRLKGVVRTLGREFGVSAQESTEAFYRFGTAGLNAEESLQGAIVALRTSIAMMGNSTQTARGLADVYNLMGDTIEDANNAQEKMERIGSTIAMLWRTNAFELNEFLSGIKNFLTTAKGFNLTLDESLGTLAVLHTLMRRGSQAGTEMSRSLIMLTRRSEQLNRFLGRTATPETERQFDTLLLVLDKLNTKLQEGGNIASDVADVFGIKGMKSTQALANELPRLIEQLDRLKNATPLDRMEALNELFELQMHTIDRQLKVMQQLKNQNLELFLISATGAGDYVSALENINAFIQNTIIPTTTFWGALISSIGASFERIMSDDISLGTRAGLVLGLSSPLLGMLANEKAIREELKASFDRAMEVIPEEVQLAYSLEGGGIIDDNLEAFQRFLERFEQQAFSEKMRMLTEELGLAKEEALKFLDPIERVEFLLSDTVNNIDTINKQLDAQATKARKVENAMLGVNSATLHVKDALDLIVKGETGLLREMGALPSQILRAKFALEDMLFPERLRTDELSRQLELLQAQHREVRGLIDLSGETLELVDIARKYGDDLAQEIGQALLDPRQIEQLSEQAFIVFKNNFPQRLRQFEAFRFLFEDIAGELRPRTNIPFAEIGAFKQFIEGDIRTLQTSGIERVREIVQTLQPGVEVNIPSISLNIDPNQLRQDILKLIKEELDNPKSTLYEKIDDVIENH